MNKTIKKTPRKIIAALGLALALAGLIGRGKAQAANNPSYEDILVTFTGALSVEVNGIQDSSNSVSGGANAILVASSATVTNDSGGFTEKWQLSVSTIPSDTANWALITTTGSSTGATTCSTTGCPGPEQYAFQALFISSAAAATCPAATSADWGLPSVVSATPQTYVSGTANTELFADSNSTTGGGTGNPDSSITFPGNSGAAPNNGDMLPTSSGSDGRGTRGLCARVLFPSATAKANVAQTIRLTITAIAG